MAYHITFEFDDLVKVIDECMNEGRFTITELCASRMTDAGIKHRDALISVFDGLPCPAREHDRVKYVSNELICYVALGHSWPDTSLPHAYLVGVTPAFNGKPITVTRSK